MDDDSSMVPEWTTEIFLQPDGDGHPYVLNGDSRICTCEILDVTRDSSKVKSKVLVDYNWEKKFYFGSLICAHKDGELLAYILHGGQSMVRVCKRNSKVKSLIRHFSGQVVDIAWAYTSSPCLLGCTDEGGNLAVYEIIVAVNSDEITVNRILLISRAADTSRQLRMPYKIRWCCYVPDDSDNEEIGPDYSRLLVVTHNNEADIVNVEGVIKAYGDKCTFEQLPAGCLKLLEQSDITAVVISPDATAIALGTSIGEVKFYVLDNFEHTRFAHQWTPHEGKSVNSLHFLDDLKHLSADQQFWKFAVTSADGNRELKLWSCETWQCLQTFRIEHPYGSSYNYSYDLQIKLDLTSKFVVLSDMDRRALYIVEFKTTPNSALFDNFCEFKLVQPALSFSVVEASRKRFRPFSPITHFNEASDETDFLKTDDYEDEHDDSKVVGVHAVLAVVNPKSLLELEIRYQTPQVAELADFEQLENLTDSDYTGNSYKDHLSDISVEGFLPSSASDTNDLAHVLISPDDFKNAMPLKFNNRETTSMSPAGSITPSATPTQDLSRIWTNGSTSGGLNLYNNTASKPKPPRQSSTSPSSQEVTNIMSSSYSLVNNRPLKIPEVPESFNLLPETLLSTTERPPTPVHNSLDLLDVNTQPYSKIEAPFDDTNTYPVHSSASFSLATSGTEMKRTATSEFETKLLMEIERLVNQVQRQEDQLTELRSMFVSYASELQNMQNVVKLWGQQKQFYDEMIKNAAQISATGRPQLEPEDFKVVIAQTIESTFKTSLETTLREEIRSSVKPFLNSLQNQLQLEIAQKLSATDSTLKETVTKLLKSKPILDAISNTTGQVVSKESQAAYKDVFQKHFIPSVESTTTNLFSQVNETFQRGAKEYVDQIKSQSFFVKNGEDALKTLLVNEIGNLSAQLKTAITEGVISSVRAHIDQQIANSSTGLKEALSNAIKETISQAMEQQQTVVKDSIIRTLRSNAATPTVTTRSPAEIQNTMLKLLQQGNYNEAFNQALNTHDLSVVLFVCSKVNASTVFAAQCALQQHVILSLVNQLSADLHGSTELKLSYLEGAVAALDKNNPAIREHIPNIIHSMQHKIRMFQVETPQNPFYGKMKMVLMASESLL